MSDVKAQISGETLQNQDELADVVEPQARRPEHSSGTFLRNCIKVPIHGRARVTAMIRVVAGIIERNGRVLICQRLPGNIFAGKWEFPGGKMRQSETPRQALERELREELGVRSMIGEPVQIVRHRYAEMSQPVQISFLRATLEETPRNLAFERILWAPRTELRRYDFLAADRQAITRLVQGEI